MSELSANGGACPINLDRKGRTTRRIMGIFMLFDGIVINAVFIYLVDVPREFRLLSFLLFFAGCLGLLQARASTCVVFAAQGKRNIGKGLEEVPDVNEANELRRRSTGIIIQSLIGAAALTAAGYFIH